MIRPVKNSEHLLKALLRITGALCLLAMVAVVMPGSWMDATHRWLGLGPLPSGPIVGYLARALSLFYALLGALLLFCSFTPRRHRALLCLLGVGCAVLGVTMWGVDISEGLPGWWKWGEGPLDLAFGLLILVLALRLEAPEKDA
jgi:hypothetical protein